MKRTVTNIDSIVSTFETDQEFLDYAKIIYKENEDGAIYPSEIHWLPENLQQALEYIEEYCTDLELNEFDLFETPELIPANIQAILDTRNEELNGYEELARILQEVEKLGYTFDYGLDAEPFGLGKI